MTQATKQFDSDLARLWEKTQDKLFMLIEEQDGHLSNPEVRNSISIWFGDDILDHLDEEWIEE